MSHTAVHRSGLAALAAIVLAGHASADISESKQKLIRELLEISGAASMPEQMAEQRTYFELMQIRRNYRPMMELAVSQQDGLSDEQKTALLDVMKDFDAFAQRFGTRFNEELNFSKLISEIYFPMYDETFSEGDLEKMVEFYRTRVGRKMIEAMPGIMQRAAQELDEVVRPVAIRIIQQIVAEERAKLAP